MKIFHEAPLSIFDLVQGMTDGDYALVHLFDSNPAYLKRFKQSKAQDREIILDNSVFELGEAYDSDRFYYWVNELKPEWFIIPDVLEDGEKTLANIKAWNRKYYTLSKSIGVVQGSTYEEVVECYKEIVNRVDKVAISFDYSFFIKPGSLLHPDHQNACGRVELINRMLDDKIIDTSKPHHLLGCSLPSEFSNYSKEMHWLDSLDTSNPVVAGINKTRYYGKSGIKQKPSKKLHTMIDRFLDNNQIDTIKYNIDQFRQIVRQTK